MQDITWQELMNTRKYVEKKALELMSHENKNDAVAGVPFENYRIFRIADRKFYSVQVNTFQVIADEFLVMAQNKYSEKFGTGEALDVLEAIYLINPMGDFDWFVRFLSHERCAYIFESENGEVVDRVLRLDLFRLLKCNQNGKKEFVGGVLHALKHFSRNGTNYSTGTGGHEINHPQYLIKKIVDAFFCQQGIFETNDQYIVLQPLDDHYNLKFVFYREVNTGVFFLKTSYKEEK